MSYKLLVLDIDGTVTNAKKEVTEKTRQAIIHLQERGIPVAIASGRPSQGVQKVAKTLELDRFGSYIMPFNGARILNFKTGECVYASPITLNDNTFDVEVTVDENHINSISLVNLSETTTAMYPLMQPALDALSDQICETQSTEHITYTEENKYTSMMLLDAIEKALDKARK